MAVSRLVSSEDKPRRPPAKTPEARENQLAAMAYDVIEKQLRDGTASSQILTQLLKSVSAREQLEKARIEAGTVLDRAKLEAMGNDKDQNVLYQAAINAMRSYQGVDPSEVDDDIY